MTGGPFPLPLVLQCSETMQESPEDPGPEPVMGYGWEGPRICFLTRSRVALIQGPPHTEKHWTQTTHMVSEGQRMNLPGGRHDGLHGQQSY